MVGYNMFRTYTRILFNGIFKKNIIVNIFTKIVNFYCNILLKDHSALKLEQNGPMNNLEKRNVLFFQSITGDKVDCR